MRKGLVLSLFLLAACTQSVDVPPLETASEAVKSEALKPQNIAEKASKKINIILPEIPGVDLTYGDVSEKGALFMVSDLTIIESQASFIIASFPERVWGPLLIDIKSKSIQVFVKDTAKTKFHVTYSDPRHEVMTTKNVCTFVKIEDPKREYETLVPKDPSRITDGEKFISSLAGLAEAGNEYAWQFFIKPDAHQKKFSKWNDGAASFNDIQERLTFMKAHDCVWQK